MSEERTLDPEQWDEVSRTFHEAVDRCITVMRQVRERPVWQPVPDTTKRRFCEGLPAEGKPLPELLSFFEDSILPYSTGNTHPRFFGWVHGSGNVAGVLGEMLAAFMNCNAGGRDHIALYLERQVVEWCKQIFSFPESSSGILTSGTSMGTLIALTAARNSSAGGSIQKSGMAGLPKKLTGYVSSEAHNCIAKTFELLGLGRDALRLIPVDASGSMDVKRLSEAIDADRADGFEPAVVIATVGTVNTGAIDDLDAIADLCGREKLWLHIDGAFGALAILTAEYQARLSALSRADSIAFDFHKWLHVPYDAGCVLVRNEEAHRQAFSSSSRPAYLTAHARGLAGGEPWYCEYGPELSRGFRALKVWFTIKAHGVRQLAESIEQNCRQAQYLGECIQANRELELMADIPLNIVCFRYVGSEARRPQMFEEAIPDIDLDALNMDIVDELQLQGIAAPSMTTIRGQAVIRVALTNHRTTRDDLDVLLAETCRLGQALLRMQTPCGTAL